MKAFFIALLLVGCAANEPKREPLSDVILAPKTDKVNIPKKLLVECPIIGNMDERVYSKKELIELSKKDIARYDACRSSNAVLIDAIKKAFNIPNEIDGSK